MDGPLLGAEGLLVPDEYRMEYSDLWITLKVEIALAARRKVRARPTEVATQHGVVTLSGKVDTEAEKHLASLVALEIEGVLEVNNQIVAPSRPF